MKRMVCLLLVCLLLAGCGQKVEALTWQEQYDLGVRYLSEGRYMEAILAFNAAIEIDPKQPEAYVGLVETYIGLEDPERARDTLAQMPEVLDSVLLDRIAQLEQQLSDGAEEPNPEPQPEERSPYKQAYIPVLEEVAAVDAGMILWDGEVRDSTGCFVDMDGDGTDELILCGYRQNPDDPFLTNYTASIYTISNGEVVTLLKEQYINVEGLELVAGLVHLVQRDEETVIVTRRISREALDEDKGRQIEEWKIYSVDDAVLSQEEGLVNCEFYYAEQTLNPISFTLGGTERTMQELDAWEDAFDASPKMESTVAELIVMANADEA